MPIHNWKRVPAGVFHDFQATWIPEIKSTLNNGLLPSGYYALAEQIAGEWSPDVLALQSEPHSDFADGSTATLLKTEPRVRFTARSDGDEYGRKARQIAIRHVSDDRLVAVIEIASPGNKANIANLKSLVDKVADGVAHGIHFLIVDLFPPTVRDPQGIHAEIWKRFSGERFELPESELLTAVAYQAGFAPMAYIEPIAVGGLLPSMPLFLETNRHILVPLEATYQAAWRGVPQRWRSELE